MKKQKRSSGFAGVEELEGRRMLAVAFPTGSLANVVVEGERKGVEIATAVVTDVQGNVYVAGTFQKSISFKYFDGTTKALTSDNQTIDIFLAKWSAGGRLQWAQQIGGLGDETMGQLKFGPTSASNPTGDLYLTGTFSSDLAVPLTSGRTLTLQTHGKADILIARLRTTDGKAYWAENVGGPYDDFVTGLAVAQSGPYKGDVYYAGTIRRSGDLDPSVSGTLNLTCRGMDDTFISHLWGWNGALVVYQGQPWVRQYGENDTNEQISGLVADDLGVFATGNYIRTVEFQRGNAAFTQTTSKRTDLYLGYLPGINGNWSWLTTMGGGGSDTGIDLEPDPSSGDLYIAGNFEDTASFGPGLTGTSLGATDEGGAFLARYRITKAAGRATGVTLVSVQQMGGYVKALSVNKSGSVFVAGDLRDNNDALFGVAPGPTQLVTPVSSTYSGFVARFSPSGLLVYVNQIGSKDGTANVLGVAADYVGSVYVVGKFNDTVDFSPNPARPYPLTTSNEDGDFDAFIAKYIY